MGGSMHEVCRRLIVYNRSDAPVAQLDRASAFEAEGHRFESCRARQRALRVVCARPASGAARFAGSSRRARVLSGERGAATVFRRRAMRFAHRDGARVLALARWRWARRRHPTGSQGAARFAGSSRRARVLSGARGTARCAALIATGHESRLSDESLPLARRLCGGERLEEVDQRLDRRRHGAVCTRRSIPVRPIRS